VRLDGRTAVVTGGAGFIGSELVRQLVSAGARVIVIDNLVTGRRENIGGLPPSQVSLVVEDIRNIPSVEPNLRGVDLVYHLACLGVRHSIHSPLENHDVNATGTLRLLRAARIAGVPRFVYVSSSEVYGTALHVPMSERHPTFPMTVYGASKLAGECYARAYYRTYGYPTVVVRPFNTYGPRAHHEGDSGEVIPKFLLRCMAGQPMVVFGDGTQTRDFTYVTDVAGAILALGAADGLAGETLNIGHGSEITVNELAQAVRTVVGKPDAPVAYQGARPGDTLRLYADIGYASKAIGYEPRVTLLEGLRALREWYASLGRPPEKLLDEEHVLNWEVPPGGRGN
jgi:UDP-glucose 4-epimerase